MDVPARYLLQVLFNAQVGELDSSCLLRVLFNAQVGELGSNEISAITPNLENNNHKTFVLYTESRKQKVFQLQKFLVVW